MLSSSFTPLSIDLTAIRHQSASIPLCTGQTGAGRDRQGEILENNTVLIDVNATLRVGDTLIPMIFRFDQTHLLNCAGNKKEWHVYMTIGNQSWTIRQMPSMHSVIMVSLLPIPIKNANIPHSRLDEQWNAEREVLNNAL